MKSISIRNVPNSLRRKVKARAKHSGMSVSAYLLAQLHEIAKQPSVEELRRRLDRREAIAALRKMPKPSENEKRASIEVPQRLNDR